MNITELFEEDPLGDFIQTKTSSDPLDQMISRFMQGIAPTRDTRTLPRPQENHRDRSSSGSAAQPRPNVSAAQLAPIRQAPGSVSWQTIAQYLRSKGLSAAHTVGILTNMEHESQFNPNTYVIDSNGLPSGGLFQHNGPRFQDLVTRLGRGWSSNWQGQIDYALGEPVGQQYIRQQFASPKQASQWWTLHFERPKHAQQKAQQRSQAAPKYTQYALDKRG